jgi:hypothetical protein
MLGSYTNWLFAFNQNPSSLLMLESTPWSLDAAYVDSSCGVMLGAKKFHWFRALSQVQTVITLGVTAVGAVVFPNTALASIAAPVLLPSSSSQAARFEFVLPPVLE